MPFENIGSIIKHTDNKFITGLLLLCVICIMTIGISKWNQININNKGTVSDALYSKNKEENIPLTSGI